jgi:hypothetical protein
VRKRRFGNLVGLFVLVSVACGYAMLTKPGWRSDVLRAYVFVAGAIGLAAVIAAAAELVPRRRSDLTQALRRRPEQLRSLPELEKLQRDVALATTSAFDFHSRLLPQLREIAEARLARTGRSLGPDTLGRWWDVLRPDREPPQERFGAGFPLAELRSLVDDLERIG